MNPCPISNKKFSQLQDKLINLHLADNDYWDTFEMLQRFFGKYDKVIIQEIKDYQRELKTIKTKLGQHDLKMCINEARIELRKIRGGLEN